MIYLSHQNEYEDAKVTAVTEGIDLPVRNEEITDWKHPWPAVKECHIRVAMQESKIVTNYDGRWDTLDFSVLDLPLFSSLPRRS